MVSGLHLRVVMQYQDCSLNSVISLFIRLEARLQLDIGFTFERALIHFRAFGYNSAESELIWMKCGAL